MIHGIIEKASAGEYHVVALDRKCRHCHRRIDTAKVLELRKHRGGKCLKVAASANTLETGVL